jgi:hypothetical protein
MSFVMHTCIKLDLAHFYFQILYNRKINDVVKAFICEQRP